MTTSRHGASRRATTLLISGDVTTLRTMAELVGLNAPAIRFRLMVLRSFSRSAGERVEGRLVEDELAGGQVFIQVLQ